MTEPKYDEDVVNLGYLNKVIENTEENIDVKYSNVSKHYATKPSPPYHKGDTWIDGNVIYICINDREIGIYVESDWTTESGATEVAKKKNQVFLRQPSNYNAGDMWILQSDTDHRAGKKGEMLITTAGRTLYDEGDWVNMLAYGTIASINEVANNLNDAINRISVTEEAISDGIIITFYQATLPEAKHIGDLWYVTETNENYIKGKIYRYNGSDWQLLDDPDITKAFEEANEARLIADGKIQSFYSEEEPTQDVGVGDLWIDTNDNNKLYRYNGTNWIAVYDTRIDTLEINVETVTERVVTIETDQGRINQKVTEVTTRVGTVETDVSNLDSKVDNEVSNLQSQIDGQIQFWNGAEIPTTNNYPATEWLTEEEKNNHRADIYTVIEDIDGELKQGKSYRFDKVNDVWVWVELTDNELSAVQALAQSKARVFTETPKPPYNVGDLWLKNQELYECTVAKDSNGIYAQSDWQVATKYTDDTIANLANNVANTALNGVNNITTTQDTLEGTEIKIDDSAEEPIIELEVDGASRQDTRSGKNLLPSLNTTRIINGVTFTKNNDGSITINGIATANAVYPINVNSNSNNSNNVLVETDKTYTLSCEGLVSGIVCQAFRSSTYYTAPKTFTPTETTLGAYIMVLNGYTIDNVIVYPQLEEGTEATEYEPYGAMPSPEFPSETQSIGDDVNLLDYTTVENTSNTVVTLIENGFNVKGMYAGKIVISNLEKNTDYYLQYIRENITGTQNAVKIFAGNSQTTEIKSFYNLVGGLFNTGENTEVNIWFYAGMGVEGEANFTRIKLQKGTVATAYSEYGKGTVEIEQTGKNKFSGFVKGVGLNSTTGEQTSSSIKATTDYIPVDFIKNPNYYLSGLLDTLQSFVGAYNSEKEFLGRTDANLVEKFSLASSSFTAGTAQGTGDIAYLRITTYENGDYTSGTIDDIDNLEVQLEEGSTATEYEPYKSNNYVIPLSKPLRSLPNGVCDTIEADGIHRRVGSVVLDGSDDETWVYTSGYMYIPKTSLALPQKANATGICTHFIYSATSTNVGYFRLGNNYAFMIYTEYTDKNEWKAWLQENPIQVDYELAEEVIEPLTEEQIEVIQSIETNLYTQYFTSDANMRITYVRNNGLADMYETKDSAIKKYTETEQKISELDINVDGISATVGEVTTRLENDYMTTDQIEAETGTIKEDIDIIKKQQASVELTSEGLQVQIDTINNEGVKTVKNTLVEIDEEGIKVSKGSEFNSLLDDTGVYLKSYEKEIASYTKDGATMYNLTVQNEAIIGNLRALSVEVDGEKRTHIHWIGG